MKPSKFVLLSFSLVATFALDGCDEKSQNEIAINHIQVIGSHNSYKQKIEEPLMKIILEKDSSTIGLDYYHIPIKDQLDLGLRSLEIDALHDPTGGRYKEPVGITLLREKGIEPQAFDSANELAAPGIKVLHVPDIDFRSHCLTFKGCLKEVKEWSEGHPNHLPIIITINPKNSGLKEPGSTPVLRFTKNVLDSLDQEILSVFAAQHLITPSFVQGDFKTLREAVTTAGWPSLESSKGKVLFVLDAGTEITNMYIEGGIAGKPMFPNVPQSDPHAAFLIMNDPKIQQQEIQENVKAGFMIRTRADADTKEARTDDFSRLEAAIASGAHVISTDYYLDRLSPSGQFQVDLKAGKYQRCNPIIAGEGCALEKETKEE